MKYKCEKKELIHPKESTNDSFVVVETQVGGSIYVLSASHSCYVLTDEKRNLQPLGNTPHEFPEENPSILLGFALQEFMKRHDNLTIVTVTELRGGQKSALLVVCE